MSASWEPFRAAPWLGPRLRPQKHSQFHVASKWLDYGLRSAVFILLFQLLRLAFLFSFLGCWFFFLLVVSCFVFCCFFNSPYTRLIAVHSICITHKTALGLPVWAAELQNTKILPLFFFPNGLLSICEQVTTLYRGFGGCETSLTTRCAFHEPPKCQEQQQSLPSASPSSVTHLDRVQLPNFSHWDLWWFWHPGKIIKDNCYVFKNHLAKKGTDVVIGFFFSPQPHSMYTTPSQKCLLWANANLLGYAPRLGHLLALWKKLAFTASFTSK